MDNFKLECAYCNKPLMNFMFTKANPTLITKVKASCPFCGKYSFTKELIGGFAFGPIGRDESSNPTKIIDVDYQGTDFCNFKVEKNG